MNNQPPLRSQQGEEDDNGFAYVRVQSLPISTQQHLCAESGHNRVTAVLSYKLKKNGRQRVARLPLNMLERALRPKGKLGPLPPQKYTLELFLSVADRELVYITNGRPSGG